MTRRQIVIAIVASIAMAAMMVRYYSGAKPLTIKGRSREYVGRQIGGESAFRNAVAKVADVLAYRSIESKDFPSPLRIAIGTNDVGGDSATFVTLRNGSQLRLLNFSELVQSCVAKQAGDVVFVTAAAPISSSAPTCRAYDQTGAVLESFSDGDLSTEGRICACPDAGYFLVRTGEVLEMRSLKDLSLIDRLGVLPDDIRAIALSKNGDSLYILTESGSFRTNATYVFDLTEKVDPATQGRKN